MAGSESGALDLDLLRFQQRRREGARPVASGRNLQAAREAVLKQEDPTPAGVRSTILASWTRSLELQVGAGDITLGEQFDAADDSPLAVAAAPVMDHVANLMAGEPMSFILCDETGVVLDRRTSDSHLKQHLDRIWLAPGFSYTEANVGTNGIGTTLESRGAAHVFGHEHWVDSLGALACAGAPIHHPISGKLVGVVDLTCWDRDATGLMITTATMLAQRISEALLNQSHRREQVLLEDYLAACRRHNGIVVAVSDEVLMLNERAQSQLDGADQSALVTACREPLSSGRSSHVVVDLPSGASVRVQCRPSFHEAKEGGGVMLVQFAPADTTASEPVALAKGGQRPSTMIVGHGPLWIRCRRSVERHLASREWVILSGESGSGRRTLARGTHLARTPAAHLRLIEAANYGPTWLEQVHEELQQDSGTLILADLDLLPAEGMTALADLLEPYRESTDPQRPWVVATMLESSLRETAQTGPAMSLTHCFPHTVEVPPLRHHCEDVAELARNFVARLSKRGELRFTPAAMAMLSRHYWPGNVTQLHQVLRKVVARRRTSVVDVSDLPPEIWTSARRMLTPLEAIESDAIVKALLETGGNKAEAASLLGLSRATIYRKVRAYGIDL